MKHGERWNAPNLKARDSRHGRLRILMFTCYKSVQDTSLTVSKVVLGTGAFESWSRSVRRCDRLRVTLIDRMVRELEGRGLKRGHTSFLNTVHVTAPDVVGSNTSVLTGGCPEVDCRIVSNRSLCSGRAGEKEGMRRGISAPIPLRNRFFSCWRKS